jgi:hypothetical protein
MFSIKSDALKSNRDMFEKIDWIYVIWLSSKIENKLKLL